MPFVIKATHGDQTRRLAFNVFPRFIHLHNKFVESFGRIDGGYRVLNLSTTSGIIICEVAEHDGDWATAMANYGEIRPSDQIVLRCEVQQVLAVPRADALRASSSATDAASCCSVDEGKREMKTLLNNFLTDFRRVYGDTFVDELNVYEGLGTRSPATVVPELPRRGESASMSSPAAAAPIAEWSEEGPLHPNIWCDRCGEHIRGVRYKCNECADYDLCGKCTRNHSADAIHCAAYDHTFKLITRPIPTRPPIAPVDPFGGATRQPGPVVHRNITCDGCNKGPIIGVRHKCLDCPDFDFCDRCKADDATHDPNHEFFELHEPGKVIVHERPMRNMQANPAEPQTQQPAVPSPPRVAHNATCNLCSSRIYGIRYKCVECPDFDVCEGCHAITNEQHPTHSFVKISQITDIIYRFPRKSPPKHRAMCDAPGCRKTIFGIRYKCMICDDFDLCQDCEALPIPVHPVDHAMIKVKNPKSVIPQILRPGQEIKVKTEPAAIPPLTIPPVNVENDIPLPQIPVLRPLPVRPTHVAPTPFVRPAAVPVPIPIRINSSSQTTDVARTVASTQTIEKRQSVASVQTSNVGEEKSIQANEPTPQPRRIRIPITEEEPKREPESPKIIVLPSVPTTEPVAPSPVPKVLAFPLASPVATQPDPMVVQIPVIVPEPIVLKSVIPDQTIQPEMSQTITQPASLFSNFLASRPALEPVSLSAAFVEDMNVIDGTTFPPGAEFIKSWKMINDGNREWPAETILVFVGGHRMAAFPNAPNSYDVGKAEVGQTVDIWAADLKAPEDPGVYNSFWRLKNGETGEFFGHRLWINIEVAAPSHSSSDVESNPSLSSSALAMPGAFYETSQFASAAPSEQPVHAAPTRRDTVASSSVITPVSFSSAHSNDDSVSLLGGSDRDDGSLVDIPVATTTTTGTTTGTMQTARASTPGGDDDEFVVVYDSASSVGH